MYKKILYFVTMSFSYFNYLIVGATDTQKDMIPWNNNGVVDNKLEGTTKDQWIDNISSWIVDSIDSLLPIAAVGVFLFVGIRIALAKWNPEEFKKAWMQFVYAVVWIFVISFSWAAVKLVTGFNI